MPAGVPSLETMIALARTQLLAQSERMDAIDLKAFTLLGLDVALAAALLAGHQSLGRRWWTPIVGLSISALLGFFASRTTPGDLTLGPEPEGFFKSRKLNEDVPFLRSLLVWLSRSVASNAVHEERKRNWLSGGMVILFATVVYSVIAIAAWR